MATDDQKCPRCFTRHYNPNTGYCTECGHQDKTKEEIEETDEEEFVRLANDSEPQPKVIWLITKMTLFRFAPVWLLVHIVVTFLEDSIWPGQWSKQTDITLAIAFITLLYVCIQVTILRIQDEADLQHLNDVHLKISLAMDKRLDTHIKIIHNHHKIHKFTRDVTTSHETRLQWLENNPDREKLN